MVVLLTAAEVNLLARMVKGAEVAPLRLAWVLAPVDGDAAEERIKYEQVGRGMGSWRLCMVN